MSFDSDITPTDAQFTQKINIEYLILRQIDRCNTASLEGDDAKFSYAVESLFSMLPKEHRVKLEDEETRKKYTETIEDYIYSYSCGKPMGTPENPVYTNKPTDWDWDGGEPILISPKIIEVERIDYQKLYRLILAELQNVGATWKVEPRENVGMRVKPPATPLIKLSDGKMIRVLIERGYSAVKDVGGVLMNPQDLVEPEEPDDGGPTNKQLIPIEDMEEDDALEALGINFDDEEEEEKKKDDPANKP